MENIQIINENTTIEHIKTLVKLADKSAFRSAAILWSMLLPALGLLISPIAALTGLAISNVLMLIFIVMNFSTGRKIRKLLKNSPDLAKLSV